MRRVQEIVFLLLMALAVAMPGHAGDSSAVAFLTVEGVRENLPVFLDRQVIGKTPLFRHPIPIGEHELIVRSPWWPEWNVPDYMITLQAAGGDEPIIHPQFIEPLYIQSIPYGADVFLGDEKQGITPMIIKRMPGSDALLRVEKTGYMPYQGRLSQYPGPNVAVTLLAREDWVREELAQHLQKQSHVLRNRRLLAGAIVLGVVSGLTTVHYRDQGNEAYDRYLHTARPDEMQRHFDDARHYDRLAGASYTIFEVAFLLGGYFFLNSREP